MIQANNQNKHILSVADLQREQRLLKGQIRQQEHELRQRVQQVPGELFYAGVNAVVPTVLSGKITNSVLNTGKAFINKAFVKKDGADNKGLVAAAKQVGLFTILKLAYRAFVSKK
jgi:hypothetical protein